MHAAREPLLQQGSGGAPAACIARTHRAMLSRKLHRRIGGKRRLLLFWSVAYLVAFFSTESVLRAMCASSPHPGLRSAQKLDLDRWLIGLLFTLVSLSAVPRLAPVARYCAYWVYPLILALILGETCERTCGCLSHRVRLDTPLGAVSLSGRRALFAVTFALELLTLAVGTPLAALWCRCAGLASSWWCTACDSSCSPWHVEHCEMLRRNKKKLETPEPF